MVENLSEKKLISGTKSSGTKSSQALNQFVDLTPIYEKLVFRFAAFDEKS